MFQVPRIALCLAVLALVGLTVAADEPRPETHRASRPVVRPTLPDVKGTARTDVDRFILAALEAKRLSLNPEADRSTRIRRVCFDLTGLPPTIGEIDAFLADKSPGA